ncbi:MAG: hypothetical protein GY711_28760 [bacterium]|nr:hypothetical protein [bacterium]
MRWIPTGVVAALLTAPSGQAQVLNLNTGEVFATIQAAIDDTDTFNAHELQFLSSTHTEGPGIVFHKSLTLRGMIGGKECSPGPFPVTRLMTAGDTGKVGDGRAWIKTNVGTICTFREITFDGTGFKTWQAIRGLGDGTLQNCCFENVAFEPSGPAYAGTGLAAIDANWTVRRCIFFNMGRVGVLFFGTDSFDCSAERMEYNGKGDGDFLDYGVEIGGGAQATLRLSVSNCRGVASVDGTVSAGVLCTTYFGAGSRVEITQSRFNNNNYGLAVGVDAADTSFATVNFCDFTGHSFGVVNSSFQNVVDATANWWGDPSGPLEPCGALEAGNPPCFPPDPDPGQDVRNADGLGDEVHGPVNYCPWLVSSSVTPGGTSYCTPNTPNSTGLPATILTGGSSFVARNEFRLGAKDLPQNQFGYFLASDGADFIDLPSAGLSDGFFCLALGENLGRFNSQVQNTGVAGIMAIDVDLEEVPIGGPPGTRAIQPGETWYFQGWHRDTPPSSRNNFTSAIAVTFQ